jgi:hypothetical protein
LTHTTQRRLTPLLLTLAVTSVYAVVRYHVFKGVPWAHLPLYVLNKAVAWSSIVLFAGAAWQAGRTSAGLVANPLFDQGRALAGAHVLGSLAQFSPATYPAFFDAAGGLSFVGEFALFGGVLATVGLLRASKAAAWLLLFPAAVALHTALVGLPNWLSPAKWPGYMPPITLLSAGTALAAAGFSGRWIQARRPGPKAGLAGVVAARGGGPR